MKKERTNFTIGLVIGVLATLLAAALAVLFIPRLRPIVGLNGTNNTTVVNNTTNETNTANTADELNTTRPPVETESDNISVTSPEPYAEISNPVTVSGMARVFENSVSIRLLDGDGSVLTETFTTADAPDIGQFGPFEINLTYDQNKYTYGTLEVFQASARDGSEIDKVRIPVSFTDGAGV